MPEALPMRQLISVSIDVFDAMLKPRYTQFLTLSMYLSPILILVGIYVPFLRSKLSVVTGLVLMMPP